MKVTTKTLNAISTRLLAENKYCRGLLDNGKKYLN